VVQTPRAEQVAIVHDGFKLIHDVQHGRKLLFNLRADPGEKVDLSGSDQGRREDLASRLQSWVNGQFTYYRSAEYRAAYFPPQFADEGVP
jgi:arylsulfatase A-like enzyme